MAISSGYSAEDLARLGPDALTRRRMLAEALLAKSAGQRKIEHPLQGAAQMAEALVNGLRVRKLDQAETAGMKSGESAWEGLFGGSSSSAPSPQAAMPSTTGAGEQMAATSPAPDVSKNGETFSPFIDTLKPSISNPYALAAVASTGKAESGWSPTNANRSWADPSESGQPGTAGGIMSWRGPRLQNLYAFAKEQGEKPGAISPATQAKFFLQENPGLIASLNKAGSVEEAQSLMNKAWAFAGHDRPGGESARRLGYANAYLPQFQGQPSQVASLDPSAGMPAAGAGPTAAPYRDPVISAPNYVKPSAAQPQQTAAIPPAGGLPPLAPPREVGTPPVPPNATPPQQMAQALTGAPQQRQGPSVQDLAKIIANPWVSDDKKKIAQVLLGKQLEQDDPMRQLQIQKLEREVNAPAKRDTSVINGRLVDNQTGKAIAEFPDKVKPTTNQQDYEYYEQREKSAGRQPLGPLEWEQAQRKAGATNVTTNVGEGDKFYENLDRKNAETFAAMSDAGIQARSKLGQINRLEGLFNNVPQGAEGAFKKIAGDWGIPIGDGTSDIQAASALLEKMVPDQRPPGSGTMSDADIKMFRASLPRIINQPGGNQLIFQTMRGIAQYEAQMGEIADQVADRAIKPAEARKLIRELKNPLEDFKIPEGSTPNEGFKELSPGVRFKKIGD